MRVLLICRYFAPDNIIAAVRFTKFAKYLARNHGVEVTVFTADNYRLTMQDPLLALDTKGMDSIQRLSYGTISRHLHIQRKASPVDSSVSKKTTATKAEPRTSGFVFWLRSWLYALRGLLEDRELFLAGKRVLRDQVQPGAFDVVFSTYNTFYCHWLASYTVRKGYARKWIADFRDPISIHPNSSLLDFCCNLAFHRIVRHSDATTVVAAGIGKYHQLARDSNKVHLLPNAYDEEDLMKVRAPEGKQGFRLAYTGVLYHGRRDLSILFRALAELAAEDKSIVENTHIDFAGPEGRTLAQMAALYGLQRLIVDHGSVPRNEALAIQKGAHMLLLSSWNIEGDESAITGKFYEYLMMAKPIVCLVSGNLRNSNLATLVRDHALGSCYEQANHEQDYQKMKEYLRKQYGRYRQGHALVYEPDRTFIENCSYRRRAGDLFALAKCMQYSAHE